jgi:hypothetical protein
VGWGALRLTDRWGGAASLAVMVCASPATLGLLMVLNDHAPTWFTLALLGAALVLILEYGDRLGHWRLGALVLLVGAVLGANAASDELAAVAGGLPFVLSLLCAAAIRPGRNTGRAAAIGIAMAAVGIASGLAVEALMHHDNVSKVLDGKTEFFTGGETVGANFRLWWQSLTLLGNGNFFAEKIGFTSLTAFACAALTLIAVAVAVRLAPGEMGSAWRRRKTANPMRSTRLAWVVYWTLSMAILSVAYIFSQLPEDLASARYLVGVLYGAAALIPLIAHRRPTIRPFITIGATIFAFGGWLGLAQEKVTALTSPTDQLANQVATIAREEHLGVGYAGYWDAAPITWASHMAVNVYPVDDCYGHICQFSLHVISSWYTSKPGTKSFLLSDPATPVPAAPSPELGTPIAVHQLGSATMYVYSYDIATKIGPEPPPG